MVDKETRDLIISLRVQGLSRDQISHDLGIGHDTVQQVLKDAHLTGKDIKEVGKLREQGLSRDKIAKQLHRGHDITQKQMKAYENIKQGKTKKFRRYYVYVLFTCQVTNGRKVNGVFVKGKGYTVIQHYFLAHFSGRLNIRDIIEQHNSAYKNSHIVLNVRVLKLKVVRA